MKKLNYNNIDVFIDEDTAIVSGSGEIPNGIFQKTEFKNIKKLIIQNNIISIGEYAFEGCDTISCMQFPETLKYIKTGAFSLCSNIKSMDIPNNTVKLGDWAFEHCINLSSLSIPCSIEKIEKNTFRNCVNLKNIIIKQ